MLVIHTEIEIQASAERVWSVLVDFPRYPDWNPFIRKISGEARPGASLSVRIQPSGGKPMSFRPRVLSAQANVSLHWLGRMLIPGLFDGDHRFDLRPLDTGGVMLEHHERFRGMLVPLFRSQLLRETRRGFEAMNAALKQRAEQAQTDSEK